MKIKYKFIIHPLYYFVAFISFFTGYFRAFTTYTAIIIIHELGHIFAGLVLKWPIYKVTLYPFGCITTFNNKINSSSIEEFLVLIYGPLFQILFYMIYPTIYHKYILFFNLLPIYPLDGSKLLLIIFNKFISFYYSHVLIYIISYITIVVLLIKNINLMGIIVFTYLMYDTYRYMLILNNYMYKFYYERYLLRRKYRKNNLIIGNNKHKMFKEKNNYFVIDGKYYKESIILGKMFDK